MYFLRHARWVTLSVSFTACGGAIDAGTPNNHGVDAATAPDDASSGADAGADAPPPSTTPASCGDTAPIATLAGLVVDGLAENHDSVFWIADDPKTGDTIVLSVSRYEDRTQRVLARSPHRLNAIAADDAYIYFASLLPTSGFAIQRVPAGGGAVDTLWTRTGIPAGLAVGAGHVVWSELADPVVGPGSVHAGDPSSAGPPRDLFVGTEQNTPVDLDVAFNGDVGWVDDTSRELWRWYASAGMAARVASGVSGLSSASDGRDYFFVTGGTLTALSFADGSISPIVGPVTATHMALSPTAVYFSTGAPSSTVYRSARGTKAANLLLDTSATRGQIYAMVADDACIYWVTDAAIAGQTTLYAHAAQ